jgi:hypothetical protein
LVCEYSKRIGDNHSLSLTATGAPQTHNKRYDELTIEEWDKQKKINNGVGYRYNAAFGYDMNGNIMTGTSYNVYHKPQISLNHFGKLIVNQVCLLHFICLLAMVMVIVV